MWRRITPEQKQEFIERARKDKVRYFQEKKAFDDTAKQLGYDVSDEQHIQESEEELMDTEGIF